MKIDAYTAIAALQNIEFLREGWFASVNILNDNEEATFKSEQMAIQCCGDWTGHAEIRFYGENVIECLAKAAAAKRERTEGS